MRHLLAGFGPMLILFLFACSATDKSREEKPALDKETLTSLITDLQLAEAILQEKQAHVSDSTDYASYYYNGIFDKYHTTREEFHQTMEYYRNHLDELEKIYKDVVERLSRLQGADPVK